MNIDNPLQDKKNSPQRLYNRLMRVEEYLPELRLIIDKIMREIDSTDDLKNIHLELYTAHSKCKYICQHILKFMKGTK